MGKIFFVHCTPLYTHCIKTFKRVISYTQQSPKENLPLPIAVMTFNALKEIKIPKLCIPVLDNTHKEVLTKTQTVTGDKQSQNSCSERFSMKGHWHKAVSSALSFFCCFFFPSVFETWYSLPELPVVSVKQAHIYFAIVSDFLDIWSFLEFKSAKNQGSWMKVWGLALCRFQSERE